MKPGIILPLLLIAVVTISIALAACAASSTSTPLSEPERSPAPAENTEEQYAEAPDFVAIDSMGRSIKLSDYVGREHVVLVINRGFGWQFCREHMAQLSRDYHEFVNRNAEIIAVGPEDMATFSEYWNEKQMPFTGIPDPNHTIADLYGQEDDPLKFGRNPVMIVIDIKGRIRFEHHGNGANDIPENNQILSLLDSLNNE